jgi:hypothetical protein
MSAPACELCRHFFSEEDCLHGSYESVGIGLVCHECKDHTLSAFEELSVVPGIASRPLANTEPRNGKKRRAKK